MGAHDETEHRRLTAWPSFRSHERLVYNEALIQKARAETMQLARVIGNVVSTVKNPALEGRKLLIIQSLDERLRALGRPLVAVDAIGAGVGELVFWCRGKEASFPFEGSTVPTDCTIIGIVDSEAHVKSSQRDAATSLQLQLARRNGARVRTD
jgi:ethanolamine utilization protein EutN